jgi:hypothetical protein
MHHTISYHLAQARAAGLGHHDRCDTLAPAVLACALRCCAGPRVVPGTARPLSPPWLATHPLAESAPPVA